MCVVFAVDVVAIASCYLPAVPAQKAWAKTSSNNVLHIDANTNAHTHVHNSSCHRLAERPLSLSNKLSPSRYKDHTTGNCWLTSWSPNHFEFSGVELLYPIIVLWIKSFSYEPKKLMCPASINSPINSVESETSLLCRVTDIVLLREKNRFGYLFHQENHF